MNSELLETFVKCLLEERFYEAHEVLEHFWFPRRFEDNDEVRLLKGFINAAVSFELLKRGRIGPSERVWNNYRKYVARIETSEGPGLMRYRAVAAAIEGVRNRIRNPDVL